MLMFCIPFFFPGAQYLINYIKWIILSCIP